MGTGPWSVVWRTGYRFLQRIDPVVRRFWRRRLPGLGPIVDLRVAGRRSGRIRATLLTRLVVDGREYIGHPNGAAAWARNLDAAGEAELGLADGSVIRVRAVRLPAGPERDRVIRATWSQQPFPANLVYTVARRHVRRFGMYFRLSDHSAVTGRRVGRRTASRPMRA